ncbi:FAD-dependent oxidoreductase [Sphingobium phenoxybenzoativorans]|uniref:FAD-dependent oxidoreductase n=1 Tax=Sphingobium phenoxybenzoativorans TaxID=1592790 RepID=A0A975KAE0_9SPHN|nr:FAD-dependent oxidoreductase [Sphingobium phenoxybenzoativorans]QUT07740.1 FAD-dependent oxidoreductase [Sphingobium phenoxybenzoativorans]
MQADVVIVGSGAAGLTAAILAARSGLSVLVLESTSVIGGTSAIAGGGIWIPNNHLAAATGVEDSKAMAEAYLRAVLGNRYDAAKIDAFLENAPDMLRYVQDATDAKFMPVAVGDYVLGMPGWTAGRTLIPCPYDGNRLGSLLKKLRSPIPEMGLFSAMQVTFLDLAILRHWNRSVSNFAGTASLLARYAWDKLRHGKGARLGNGNALVAGLLRSAIDSGVEIWTDAPAQELIKDQVRVTGVVCRRESRSETINVSRAVILATGGCGANPEMRRRYIPDTISDLSLQPEGCTGGGLTMGEAAGGRIEHDNEDNGIWVPVSVSQRKDGSIAKLPSLILERHCPGSIMVDAATGRRFVNEGLSYQHFGRTAIKHDIRKAYILSDAPAVRKYGLGMVKPAPFSVRPWVEKGYVIEGDTVSELASKIGLDASILNKTIADFNRHAVNGEDPDFQRGQDSISAGAGDPEHKPNPALGPLKTGPFYALPIVPGDLSIFAGLETDAHARVTDRTGNPIPGLYAVGLDSNSLFRGCYPGAGASIGPAMTFAYIAARDIAAAA